MELVVTLSEFNNIHALADYGVSIMAGSDFSSRFSYTREELRKIVSTAKQRGIKVYVSVDAFINENDLTFLYEYIEDLKIMDVDGIYFNDLAVYNAAQSFGIENKLIYDGGPMITNSLDVSAYLSLGIDSVTLAREMTLDEDTNILRDHAGKLDMQIFGHLRMSTSKRMFMSNYFKYIGADYNPKNRDNLTIVEEKRDYSLPIKETEYGTNIYTDYILECSEEIPYFNRLLKRGIMDDAFIDFDVTLDAVRSYVRIRDNNAQFIAKALRYKYPEVNFDSGYFFTKTNIIKENEKD